ncbi:MAG: hypothetical protein ACJ79S_12900 [Gemmatimonadaceae bacterium]
MSRALREWKEGVILGLWVATALASWAAVVWLIGSGGAKHVVSVSLPTLIAGYFLMGLLGGSVYGLLFSLRTRLLGAIALGVIVWTIVFSVLGVLFFSPEDWVPGVPVAAAVLGLAAGPVSGAMAWYYTVHRRKV